MVHPQRTCARLVRLDRNGAREYYCRGENLSASLLQPVTDQNGMRHMDKTLTPGQVAERLQVPVGTVREWLRESKLRGVKVKNRWRVREAEVERFAGGAKGEERRTKSVHGMRRRVMWRRHCFAFWAVNGVDLYLSRKPGTTMCPRRGTRAVLTTCQ